MTKYVFPKDFAWGTATAAYHIEGAFDQDGKGESIWDRFCQNPANNVYGETGKIACDHYHLYKKDVQLMKELGHKAYRFSISWPRIFPNGTGKVNEQGLQFYSDLVDELLSANIEPYLTLYHWDLPQKLQNIGGWLNRDMPKYFQEYSRLMFETFGSRVKKWITLNEPVCSAYLGHFIGSHAPGLKDLGASLEAAYNLLCAHGQTVKLFRDMHLDGEIGITLVHVPYEPVSNTQEDLIATRYLDGIFNRMYFDPIFKGEFPEDIFEYLKKLGITLPEIYPQDMELIKQKLDFVGVNYYFAIHVRHDKYNWPFPADAWPMFGKDSFALNIPFTDRKWTIEPEGLTKTLLRLKNEYGIENIYITENGASYNDVVNMDGEIEDYPRIDYLRRHFIAAHDAISAGVNLKGYFVWSFCDNYEWNFGKYSRFGIVYNDFETQRRIIKKSGYWYKDVIKANGLD